MYAQLGNIRFEGLRGFTSFEQKYAVNYAQHERIKDKPRLERVGDVLDTISFEMYLHSEFTNPETDVAAMRKFMQDSEILPLVLGNGVFVGNFVIPSFTKTTSFTDANGNLISVNLAVELLESFSENPVEDERRKRQKTAFATASRNSEVRSVLPAKLSPSGVVVAEVAKIETTGNLTAQYVESADKNANSYEFYSKKITDNLNVIERGLSNVERLVYASESMNNAAPLLPSSIQGVYTSVQNMRALMPISDINEVKTSSNLLQRSISGLQLANINNSNASLIRRR